MDLGASLMGWGMMGWPLHPSFPVRYKVFRTLCRLPIASMPPARLPRTAHLFPWAKMQGRLLPQVYDLFSLSVGCFGLYRAKAESSNLSRYIMACL